MEFPKPQKYTARVSDSYYVTDNKHFLLVKFELTSPDRLEFAAGQYVSIRIDEAGNRRSYSIASTSDDDHGFTILAEMVPTGVGSAFLTNLAPGDGVEVLAPLGRFVVDPSQLLPDSKILFVATGSGIVPIYSMINDLLINNHESRPMRLHWGMHGEENLFWFDNFMRLAEEHANFVFDPVLSHPSDDWDLCTGHVQDCLSRDFGEERLVGWHAYICGNPNMVEEVSTLVLSLGLQHDAIHTEKFS